MGSGKARRLLARPLLYALLIAMSIAAFIPLFWMLSTSLKTYDQILAYPPRWIPSPAAWSNYREALLAIDFFVYLRNTVLVTVAATLAALASSSLAAYGFGRFKVPGSSFLFGVLVATMILPGQVTMVPVFILFRKLGWYNSLKALILPAFLGGGAFNIFLLRQFFKTLPMELFEAAKIDGCGEFRMYALIALPLCRPALAAIAIFLFRANWTDFMTPLIYLNDERLYTLALGLRFFQSTHSSEFSYLMAASFVFILPIVLVFFFAQRQFIEGINLTGIKG